MKDSTPKINFKNCLWPCQARPNESWTEKCNHNLRKEAVTSIRQVNTVHLVNVTHEWKIARWQVQFAVVDSSTWQGNDKYLATSEDSDITSFSTSAMCQQQMSRTIRVHANILTCKTWTPLRDGLLARIPSPTPTPTLGLWSQSWACRSHRCRWSRCAADKDAAYTAETHGRATTMTKQNAGYVIDVT